MKGVPSLYSFSLADSLLSFLYGLCIQLVGFSQHLDLINYGMSTIKLTFSELHFRVRVIIIGPHIWCSGIIAI